MKVEASEIVKFLDQIKAMAEDINYTIRCGDDGFEETVNNQVDSISKAIELFKLERLTPITPLERSEKIYERINEKLVDKAPIDLSQGEAINLYKAKLYFALKRIMNSAKNVTWSEIPNEELMTHIEYVIPDDSIYKQLIYSQQYYLSSMHVLQEIVDEIIEQRRKAPQTKLF